MSDENKRLIMEAGRQLTEQKNKIEVLEKKLDRQNKRWNGWTIKAEEQIAELKEKFERREEHQFYDYFKLQRFEKVLRDHIDQHWKIADADRDDLNIIHSWKGKLILLLEKLDSKEKLPEPAGVHDLEELYKTNEPELTITHKEHFQLKKELIEEFLSSYNKLLSFLAIDNIKTIEWVKEQIRLWQGRIK